MNEQTSQEVPLRDGSMVFEPAIIVTWMSVQTLMEREPLAFWELVGLARKPDHVIFAEPLAQKLADFSLLEVWRTADGRIDLARSKPHQMIRDVVRNMVEGELPYVRLVNPRPLERADEDPDREAGDG